MTTTRRNVLRLIGGGTVVAATGVGAFLGTRTPERALAPWQAAGGYADPRMQALSYAILSPNPHNRQPWQVRLDGEDGVTIYRDTTLRLPHTDPYDRQLTIGMGCFVEQMRIAASMDGVAVDIEPFPEGTDDDAPVAKATFRPGATPDPLAGYMMDRRSCKEPFDQTRAVGSNIHAELRSISDARSTISSTSESEVVESLKTLSLEAWLIENETPRTMQESVDLMRIGKAEINANPDGIDLGGPFLESLSVLGQLDREQLADPSSMAFQTGVDMYTEMLTATPAYVWQTTQGNTREDQLAAGQGWLRLNLTTTALGLSLHPISQCLQEYPEMSTHLKTAHDLLAEPGETVQMLGRLGYGPTVPLTPRWPIEEKLIGA